MSEWKNGLERRHNSLRRSPRWPGSEGDASDQAAGCGAVIATASICLKGWGGQKLEPMDASHGSSTCQTGADTEGNHTLRGCRRGKWTCEMGDVGYPGRRRNWRADSQAEP